ncbi:hypothetical protein SDC9_162813 [bioreactor metagenome]|uniref:Uncharacterized protein n=1 Tax=bioreactor metagenome TaxID=1076179 RepID=A0A645FQ37_9ZZZZ
MNDLNTRAKEHKRVVLKSELIIISAEELKGLYRKLRDYEDQIQSYQQEKRFFLKMLSNQS